MDATPWYHIWRGEWAWPEIGVSARRRDIYLLKVFAGKKRHDSIGRKVFAFLVLIVFCVSALPIPIATLEIQTKDHSQPFPCQNSPCGCKTAEQCWTNCCCSTPEERLAWAEEHEVTPPSYAVQSVQEEAVASSGWTNPPADEEMTRVKSKCCEHGEQTHETYVHGKASDTVALHPTDNDCRPTAMETCGSCCSNSQEDLVEPVVATRVTKKSKLVLSMFALKCQGKISAFSLLPWMIIATAEKWVVLEREPGAAYLFSIEDPSPVFLKPDIPPPRQMLS